MLGFHQSWRGASNGKYLQVCRERFTISTVEVRIWSFSYSARQTGTPNLKGKLQSEKCLSQLKEREKCKNEPSLTSMRQMILEIFHFKVMNLRKMDINIS